MSRKGGPLHKAASPACIHHSLRMIIYQLIFKSLVVFNGLLSISAARIKCSNVTIANGIVKIRSKGRIAVYKCERGFYLLGEPYAACIRGKWDSNPPICLRPGCPATNKLLNGVVQQSWRSSLLRFSCDPGYTLIGPSYIYCNGKKWSAMQPYCKAIDINCSFENRNTCNWEIDDDDEVDFNWRLQQHEPPSRVLKTGPLHDHTLSPNNSGTLNVFLNNNLAFQRRGNHGDRWIKGVISLHEKVFRSELQLIIEGSYGGGYTGDIGLDDFTMANGNDCIASKVTSCNGRCYEDHEDSSFCLCNPQCLTDSSCCDDFMQVCSLESTTTLYEASTGLEDNTPLYFNTPATSIKEYDTNYLATNSNTTPELELVNTSDYIFNTDEITYTMIKGLYTEFLNSNPTLVNKEEKKYSTAEIKIPSSLATEHTIYLTNSESTNHIHNHSTDPTSTTLQEETVDMTTTESTPFFSETSSPEINFSISRHSIPKNYTIRETEMYSSFTETPLKHLSPIHNINQTSTQQPLSFSSNENSTLNNSKGISESALISSTLPSLWYIIYHHATISSNISENLHNTTNVSFNSTWSTIQNITHNKTLITYEFQEKTTKYFTTELLQTNTIQPEVTYSDVNNTSYFPKPFTATLKVNHSIPASSMTEVIYKMTSNTVHPLNIHTLYNDSTTSIHHFTTSIPIINNTLSKISNDKSNGSHTHLQTTEQIHTTPLVTSIETNTTQIKPITITPNKKWKSIYRPKGRFMFSAVRSNKDSGNQTLIVTLVSGAVLSVFCILLVIFFLKKRRSGFRNQLEEADTDILYHSSQELLDFHIARPSQ